jgi:arylsulfatase A-like enzyme
MNVIWIISDTLRRDHLGAYGNTRLHTPALDRLAAQAVRFDRHYSAGFPTMPSRADYFTGRWTISFMGWEPLPDSEVTIGEIVADRGIHTAAMVDTPFYMRFGMNYDRGFQTFQTILGQEGSQTRILPTHHHESRDATAARRFERDYCAPQTFSRAMEWLEQHYKEKFFLLIDTWDPHEPWDAPAYYTERYWPNYDGEVIQPIYAHWQDVPGYTAERVAKAHATYCGEISMVDTWVGHLLRHVENLGLRDKTAVVFHSDHGFYFGEHGGSFGKMNYAKRPDGAPYFHGEAGASWDHSPLYEELVNLPLFISVPGVAAGQYGGLSSAVDLMPTVLDLLGVDIPGRVEGHSLLPKLHDATLPGREFVVSTLPFANPGDRVRTVDNVSRPIMAGLVTTVTTPEWSLMYSVEPGRSELYQQASDPKQEKNVIGQRPDVARELHQLMLKLMRETNVRADLLEPRLKLQV